MPGLRVHHSTLRNGILQIPVLAKTKTGRAKQVSLRLDSQGDALISQGVWDELVEAAKAFDGNIGLLVLNEVPDPPAQIIGDTPTELLPTWQLEREAITQIAPAGVSARIETHPINVKGPL